METIISKILDKKLHNNEPHLIKKILSYMEKCKDCDDVFINEKNMFNKTCSNTHLHDGKEKPISKCDECILSNTCDKCGDEYCDLCIKDRNDIEDCGDCCNKYCTDCIDCCGVMYSCDYCDKWFCCKKVFKIDTGNDYVYRCEDCINMKVLRGECCKYSK